MLKMSKLTDYAMLVMSSLADAYPHALTTRQIAEKTHLSLPTVSKLLKMLTTQKLLISQRGIQGGYRLSKSPADISLNQILAVMEGQFGLTA